MKNKVEFCVPPFFNKAPLDYEYIKKKTGKEFRYASKGRYSIYHILVSLKIERGLLLPAYFCETILDVLNMLNIPYQFYDLNLIDLNPDVLSVENKIQMTNYDCVLVPSFYGNSADLSELESVCKKHGAKMIDDAAQSFGAVSANGKLVGTYGDGGLLAFSPGKSTMAHMGSLYWTSNEMYKYHFTRHNFYHFCCYMNFLFNRQFIYKSRYIPLFLPLGFYHKLLKDRTLVNDTMARFENEILGGCLQALFDEKFQFYNNYYNYFSDNLKNNKYFSIVKNVYGQVSVPRKIVLLFTDEKKCNHMKEYLYKKKIAFFSGYNLLPGDYTDIPNTLKIVNHVIELPIEDNAKRMDYVLGIINQGISKI